MGGTTRTKPAEVIISKLNGGRNVHIIELAKRVKSSIPEEN
jgi:hypothetical protein